MSTPSETIFTATIRRLVVKTAGEHLCSISGEIGERVRPAIERHVDRFSGALYRRSVSGRPIEVGRDQAETACAPTREGNEHIARAREAVVEQRGQPLA